MGKRPDVKVSELGTWDDYANVSFENVLPAIFDRAQNYSKETRDWYWDAISTKRDASITIRTISFVLLVCGAVFPILSGVFDAAETRVILTQSGVIVLAVAGLLQAADRVFGWSSGWLRYITTVTAMENATRQFKLKWTDYVINKTGGLSESDKKPLFDMAKQFEDDIARLQSEETDKWVVEFNSSLAVLNDLIKSQRESAEKVAEVQRSVIEAHANKAEQEADDNLPGAIEIKFIHPGDPEKISIQIDEDDAEEFLGMIWSKLNVSPGLHKVNVTVETPKTLSFKKAVKVPAGETVEIEMALP